MRRGGKEGGEEGKRVTGNVAFGEGEGIKGAHGPPKCKKDVVRRGIYRVYESSL
jgi:hypothetical protein